MQEREGAASWPGLDESTATPLPIQPPREALYPNAYVWYIFVSVLDIICTYLILHPIFSSPAAAYDPPTASWQIEQRGREVNAVANWILHHGDIAGMVFYKFILATLVISICEFVGRRRPRVGRRLAEWAVAVSCTPVIIAIAQMAKDLYVSAHGWAEY